MKYLFLYVMQIFLIFVSVKINFMKLEVNT